MEIPVFGEFTWNPQTKRISDAEGREVGSSTYERALWTPPWYNFWASSRYLNPLNYPTVETADKTVAWARTVAPTAKFQLETSWDASGQIDKPQIFIVATNPLTGEFEKYGAGLLAFGLDKNGEAWQRASFRAELKLAKVIA